MLAKSILLKNTWLCLLFTILALLSIYGCTPSSPKTIMNDQTFWQIIDASFYDCDNNRYQDECLHDLLTQYHPQQILEFYSLFENYRHKADRGDIWAAGLLLNSGHGTDDGFVYFRNWLISMGKEVYFNALENPDSLADVAITVNEDGHTQAEYEEFAYIAVDVYEKKTNGRILYDDLEEKELADSDDWYGGDFDNPQWLTKNLPHLYQKYGHLKEQAEQEFKDFIQSIIVTEVNIPNLGTVRVNHPIYHKNFGQGIVREIYSDDVLVTSRIEFSDGIHPFFLDDDSETNKLFSLKPFPTEKRD